MNYRIHIFHPYDDGPHDPVDLTFEQVCSYMKGLFTRRTIILMRCIEAAWSGLYLVTGDGDSIFVQELP